MHLAKCTFTIECNIYILEHNALLMCTVVHEVQIHNPSMDGWKVINTLDRDKLQVHLRYYVLSAYYSVHL